jgi:esterase/lipase superfamily enzyme
VTTTALRELVIQSRASGRDPRLDLKIANLVMAAPDLDFGVVRQRLIAEKFGPAIGQITIYSRKADQALGASETLMGGTRFGRVQASDLGAQEEIIFATVTNVNIIDVKGAGGAFGHGYFRDNPAVSSDLILLLRDEALPGSTSRPLIHKFLNFWEMSKDYPRVAH